MKDNIETLTGTAITLVTTTKIGKGLTGMFIYFIDQFLLFDNFKLFIIVVAFWLMDMIAGIIIAIRDDIFNHKRLFKGVGKLIIYLCYVAIGIGLNEVFGTGGLAYSIILGAVIIQESISIFDKFEKLGYATPIRIKEYLPTLKKKNDKD